MVQSISQYEFIYEYILDYLSSQGLVTLKFPRNTFGLEEDEVAEDSADQDDQKDVEGLDGQASHQEEAAYDFEANETGKQPQLNPVVTKPPLLLDQEMTYQEKDAASEEDPETPELVLPPKKKPNKFSKLAIDSGFDWNDQMIIIWPLALISNAN